MLEEGYAAVTSRHVAAAAGLKPQLVHYYFRTMDDLFLALFRRLAEQGLERQVRAFESEQPLWAVWDLSRDAGGNALTMEFTALANHRKEIRAEFAASAERYRTEQARGLAVVLERYGIGAGQLPPVVLSVLMTSVSQVLVIEQESGMTTGHAETVVFVEDFLSRFEGPRRAARAAT